MVAYSQSDGDGQAGAAPTFSRADRSWHPHDFPDSEVAQEVEGLVQPLLQWARASGGSSYASPSPEGFVTVRCFPRNARPPHLGPAAAAVRGPVRSQPGELGRHPPTGHARRWLRTRDAGAAPGLAPAGEEAPQRRIGVRGKVEEGADLPDRRALEGVGPVPGNHGLPAPGRGTPVLPAMRRATVARRVIPNSGSGVLVAFIAVIGYPESSSTAFCVYRIR